MTDWINSYQTNCTGATIDYQAVGSGAGVQDFINNQTSFAGSDSALKPRGERPPANARCATGTAINIPMVGGAIAIAYNLEGVDKLILTPDAARRDLRQHHHQVERPEDRRGEPRRDPARREHRAVPPLRRVGHHGQLHEVPRRQRPRPVDLRGRQGLDRLPAARAPRAATAWPRRIKTTPNSIGYIELSFVKNQSLTAAQVDNGGGAVTPDATTAANTLVKAKQTGTGDDLTIKVDYTIKDADGLPDRARHLRDHLPEGPLGGRAQPRPSRS